MNIVVNLANFSNQAQQQFSVVSAIIQLTKQIPQLQWYIVSRMEDSGRELPPQIQWVCIPLSANNRIAWQYWLNYKLIRFAKKNHAACILQSEGLFCNRGNIPQYVISYPPLQVTPKFGFKARFCTFFSKQAKQTVPSSVKSFAVHGKNGSDELAKLFPQTPVDHFLESRLSNTPKLLPSEKQTLKDHYTQGYEYFVYAGAISANMNLIPLLKAFTQFKKWQQSKMQLVLINNQQPADPVFLETLALYKYKSEVVVVSNATDVERLQLLQSAYMAIFPMDYGSAYLSLITCVEAGVPVIVRPNADILETIGHSGARIIESSPESIAAAMIELYKDENKYLQLASEAISKLQQVQTPTLESILGRWFSTELTA